MKIQLLSCSALSMLFLAAFVRDASRDPFPPAVRAGASAPAAVHCQVPCGIYGDQMRIDMLMEDAATIEKAMKSLTEMEGQEHPSSNQMVRWIVTKDEHAQAIQDQVASYWLAQRIKLPAAEADAAALAKYHRDLALLHGITVAAMKCKQTTDAANVETVRKLALDFSGGYFTGADLEHIRSHHGGGGGDHR